MASETPNIDELKLYVEALHKLLEDPHPGLMTWQTMYEGSVDRLLGFFGTSPWPNVIVAKKDLLGIDVPLPKDPKDTPKPTCSRCGGEIPTFYCYLFKLKTTQGTLLLNSFCCPHAGCRALFAVQPLGLETSSGLALPGGPSWPGMPDA